MTGNPKRDNRAQKANKISRNKEPERKVVKEHPIARTGPTTRSRSRGPPTPDNQQENTQRKRQTRHSENPV